MLQHSFVILAYKESPYIEECIQSLLKQTVKSDIVICTSTPNSFLNLLSAKYNIPLAINEKGGGIGPDWNFAYNVSNTQYVTLAHQDDLYAPNYIEVCLTMARGNADNLIVFTDYSEIINSNTESHRLMLYVKRLLLWPYKFNLSLRSKFWKRLIVSFGNPISCPSVMYNKPNLKDFAFFENMKTNMDWLAWLTLSKMKGSIVCVPQRLTYHRIHPDSETSNTINNNARKLEDYYIFEQIWGKLIAGFLMKFYSFSYKSNFSKIK